MLLARVIGRLLIALVVLLGVDDCLRRRPRVDLGNGYEIVAASDASPCVLGYRPGLDGREYSGWRAVTSTIFHGPDDTGRTSYMLLHNKHNPLEFDNEDAWRQAWRKKKASFELRDVGRVEGITGFRKEGPYVIGACNEGFFLLDTAQNRLHTSSDKATWAATVHSIAGTAPRELSDPKSWLVQSRNLALLAVLAALSVPWCLWPLARRKRRP